MLEIQGFQILMEYDLGTLSLEVEQEQGINFSFRFRFKCFNDSRKWF